MRRFLSAFFIFLLTMVDSRGQDWTRVDSFDVVTGFVTRNHTIDASRKQGELVLRVGIMGGPRKPPFLDNASTYFIVEGETRINAFIASLKTIRNKYEEWSKTARENHITSFSKQISVDFPQVGVAWSYFSGETLSRKTIYDRNVVIVPKFFVRGSNCNVNIEGKAFIKMDNDFGFFLSFYSVKEIDSLINKIQPQALKKALDEKQKIDDLFQ